MFENVLWVRRLQRDNGWWHGILGGPSRSVGSLSRRICKSSSSDIECPLLDEKVSIYGFHFNLYCVFPWQMIPFQKSSFINLSAAIPLDRFPSSGLQAVLLCTVYFTYYQCWHVSPTTVLRLSRLFVTRFCISLDLESGRICCPLWQHGTHASSWHNYYPTLSCRWESHLLFDCTRTEQWVLFCQFVAWWNTHSSSSIASPIPVSSRTNVFPLMSSFSLLTRSAITILIGPMLLYFPCDIRVTYLLSSLRVAHHNLNSSYDLHARSLFSPTKPIPGKTPLWTRDVGLFAPRMMALFPCPIMLWPALLDWRCSNSPQVRLKHQRLSARIARGLPLFRNHIELYAWMF